MHFSFFVVLGLSGALFAWWALRLVSALTDPPCPKCESHDIESIRCGSTATGCCNECGHIWHWGV